MSWSGGTAWAIDGLAVGVRVAQEVWAGQETKWLLLLEARGIIWAAVNVNVDVAFVRYVVGG